MAQQTVLHALPIVLGLGGCVSPAPRRQERAEQTGKAPAIEHGRLSPTEKGEFRAREDIAKGTRRILYYGKPWSVGKALIDDASGLPVELVAGCDVTPDFAEETDAYNRIMRELARDSSGKPGPDVGE